MVGRVGGGNEGISGTSHVGTRYSRDPGEHYSRRRPLEFRRNSSWHNIRLDRRSSRISSYPREKVPLKNCGNICTNVNPIVQRFPQQCRRLKTRTSYDTETLSRSYLLRARRKRKILYMIAKYDRPIPNSISGINFLN